MHTLSFFLSLPNFLWNDNNFIRCCHKQFSPARTHFMNYYKDFVCKLLRFPLCYRQSYSFCGIFFFKYVLHTNQLDFSLSSDVFIYGFANFTLSIKSIDSEYIWLSFASAAFLNWGQRFALHSLQTMWKMIQLINSCHLFIIASGLAVLWLLYMEKSEILLYFYFILSFSSFCEMQIIIIHTNDRNGKKYKHKSRSKELKPLLYIMQHHGISLNIYLNMWTKWNQ